MKYKELAAIALKMFGIYWFIKAATNLMQIVLVLLSSGKIAGGPRPADMIGWALLIALYAVIGYVLTFRTAAVIQAVKVEDRGDASPEVTENSAGYQRLGFTLLGVFFAVPAASALIPQIIKLIVYQKVAPGYYKMYQESFIGQEWPRIVENSIQLIVGVSLIVGMSRLRGLWSRLRPLSTVNDKSSEGQGYV